MKKADPRLMLIMSMTVFGTLGLFVPFSKIVPKGNAFSFSNGAE